MPYFVDLHGRLALSRTETWRKSGLGDGNRGDGVGKRDWEERTEG